MIMIRRTTWRYYEDDDEQTAGRVARWMTFHFGWDECTIDEELERYENTVSETVVACQPVDAAGSA